MNQHTHGQSEDDRAPVAARSYLALSGMVDADPKFIKRLLSANWARRILYNAGIDQRVPFAEGVAHRLALALARRAGAAEPSAPVPSERFQPVPRPLDLHPVITELRQAHPELARWPVTMLRLVLDEACRARARHVAACVLAKEEGRKLPRLHFRSASDPLDVSTENMRLLRCGDGAAVTKPKRRSTPLAEARRLAKARAIASREQAWAEKRRAAGMTETRIKAGLRERAERQAADRERQVGRQPGRDRRNAPLPRRDSPSATVGKSRVKVEVQGLGRVRIRLSRPIPAGPRSFGCTS